MKDFLNKFQTIVNYNTWKSSENYIEPNVSLITENEGSIEYTRLKPSGSVSTAPVANSLTYDGTAQTVAIAGTGTGTMMYRLGDSGDYSSTMPTATNAGSYTLYYYAAENANYSATTPASISITINKAAGSVSTAPVANSLTYDGTAQTVASAGTGTGTMMYRLGDSGDYISTMPTATNAGSYTLYYYAAESTNYNATTPASISVTINKAVGSVSTAPVANSLTYDETAQTVATAGVGTGTMMYRLGDSGDYSSTIPTATNAGSYTLYYYAAESTNYNATIPASIYVTINEPVTPSHNYANDYLTIVSLQDNNTIGWKTSNASLLKTISISTDGGTTWTDKTSSTTDTTLATLNTGDKLLVKGSNAVYGNSNYYNYFTSTGNFNLEGNIMSMIYGDNFVNQTTLDSINYTLRNLFSNCSKLVSVENLILPATTLVHGCYYNMFANCTALTTAPELPATTLVTQCYYSMFYNCTSLTTAPELPATTLTDNCYRCMFQGCTSLNYIKCLATNISASNCTTNWVQNVAASGIFIKADNMTSWTIGTAGNGMPSGWTVINVSDLPIGWEQLSYSIPINSIEKPKLGNPYNVPVIYTSSDTTIATIDANGVVRYIDEGTVTLTASFAGNNDYQAKTTTCTLIITEYYKSAECLTIESLQDNNTIKWKAYNASLLKTISISTDGGTTWSSKESSTSGTTLATLNSGDKLLVKGSNTAYGNNSNYNYFTSTGNFNVEGNIMSMIYGDNFVNQATLDSTGYNFKRLFYNCTKLISAENLILPTTTLTTGCYNGMFNDCTALTTVTALPATTLASNCYEYMFKGCRSLTTAPELPATTLAIYCYSQMFYNCTSLATAPELPATTLAGNCYDSMFYSCTSLITAPDLPATTLANRCYQQMFYGCTTLNYIKCLATNKSATDCTKNWVQNVAATGTFVKNASMSSWTTGVNAIPSGWTVQDAA